MGKPAARIGDMHVCPMVTGLVPHVGGPVMGPGVPTVLIGGMPAAVMGDMCVCVGPPDTIVLGSTGVLIGGKPAARMGDQCAHGGAITLGCPTVLIGETMAGGGGFSAITGNAFRNATQTMSKGVGQQVNQAILLKEAAVKGAKYAEMSVQPSLTQFARKILDKIHKTEGGYVDDPADPGGKTKFGIAELREWPAAAKFLDIDPNPENIKNINSQQADEYYIHSRFQPYRINEIKNEKVANALFDQSVLTPNLINRNTKKSLNDLGYDFPINNDRLTDKELSALNEVNKDEFVNKFTNHQLEYFQSLDKPKYINGWTNRLNELKK